MIERVADLIERVRAKLVEEHARVQETLKAGERF